MKNGSGRIEIRLAGSGGQGILLAGGVLAEAAILSGLNATQSQTYGPESRGGDSRTDVIISDDEIGYPKIHSLDVLVALTREACERHHRNLKPGGLLLVDAREVPDPPSGHWVSRALPLAHAARLDRGREAAANIVALGALVGIKGVVERAALEQAVAARVPSRTREMNLRALASGIRLANGEDVG